MRFLIHSYLNRASKSNLILVALAVMLLISSTVATGCISSIQSTPASSGTSSPANSQTLAEVQAPILFDENIITSLYDHTIPAVVQIETVMGNSIQIPLPFGFNVPKQNELGSGFIIDDQGHILTNNHVIDGATRVTVKLHDGTELNARVLGTDRGNDIALIQIDQDKVTNIVPLSLGDSDTVKPGQMAIAMGSPYGLEGSITVGVISGIGRSIQSTVHRAIVDVIQTDAAINPGNSGGPLLNSKGEVVGINTAIESYANSIGYAIPVNTAKSLLPTLIKGENVTNSWLGIEGTAINSEIVKQLNLPVDKGVYIVGVTPNSPAQKAGLREGGRNSQGKLTSGGDIITAVDGISVAKVEDLISYFNSKKPGDEVTLSVIRESKQISVKVTLAEWPS